MKQSQKCLLKLLSSLQPGSEVNLRAFKQFIKSLTLPITKLINNFHTFVS